MGKFMWKKMNMSLWTKYYGAVIIGFGLLQW